MSKANRSRYAIRACIFSILGFIACHCSYGQFRDTLFMKNGQILIGKLKGMSLGKVDFDATNITIVTIKADKIATIKAVDHIYKIQTIDKEIFYSQLEVGSSGTVSIRINGEPRELAIQEIAALIPLLGKTGGLWQGNVSIGYSYTRSSDVGRFNSDFSIGYERKKTAYYLKSSLISTHTDSTNEVDNANANFLVAYTLSASWQGVVIFNYQHNLELGLKRRYQEGLAISYNLLSSLNFRSRIMSGAVLSQEKNTDDVVTPTQMEVPLIFMFSFFKFAKPDMSVNMTQSIYAGITQWGRFRQDGDLTVKIKIIKDFYVNLQLYDNFDNQPPGENAAKIDYGIVFGVSYKFSQ